MEKIIVVNDPERYENIFNMYKFDTDNGDTYAFYNILSKVVIPPNLNDNVFDYISVEASIPLTTLSYNLYKTQHLWWLIMTVNNIKNPVKLLQAGSIIKIIKLDYIDTILNSLKNKI